MRMVVTTKAFQNRVIKTAQQQKHQRFWGEMTVNIFVPWPEINADPNNPRWREEYQKVLSDMKKRAEIALQESVVQFRKMGTAGLTDPDISVSIREANITGTD